jgi:hypothetical protein
MGLGSLSNRPNEFSADLLGEDRIKCRDRAGLALAAQGGTRGGVHNFCWCGWRHKGRLTTTNSLLIFSSTYNNSVFKKIIMYVIAMAPSTSRRLPIPRTTALIREDVRLNLTSEGN